MFEAQGRRFASLSLRSRVALVVACASLVAAAILAYAVLSEPRYGVLYSQLSADDAAHIVERLHALHVPYEVEDGGATIRVPEESVHETRLTLAGEGLPRGSGVGFELFDEQRFGESDFSEQIQYRRALEGELARTISTLSGVESARVHLVLPERTLFTDRDRGASASVALRMRPGWRVSRAQVQGVVHLVASSVPGLAPEAVTVVDGEGRPLTSGDDAQGRLAGSNEVRERIERHRQKAVQDLLDLSLGPGVAVAQVSAQIDFSRVERVEETYDPEQVATRSFEVTAEGPNGGNAGAAGVPGAVSNLPGGPAPETPGGGAAPGSRRTERRNFEITKTVHRAVSPIGRLSRLTVAVVVDGTWTGEGAERTFEPRPEEEMNRIRALASTAAGLDESRGDVITVECVPFHVSSASETAAEPDPYQAFLDAYGLYAAIALGVLLLLILLLVIWVVRARRRRRKQKEAEEKAKKALPAPEEDGEESESVDGELLFDNEGLAAFADYEELRAITEEVASKDPVLTAQVVRTWILEDAGEEESEDGDKEDKEVAA